jgi:hypothetical protein
VSFELEPLVLRLAEEFKRRGMERHVALLRRFYVARRRWKQANAQRPPKEHEWDAEMVLEWLSLFRIAPFESIYATLPRTEGCPCGAKDSQGRASSFTSVVFPGGCRWTCLACRRSWLVHDEPGK